MVYGMGHGLWPGVRRMALGMVYSLEHCLWHGAWPMACGTAYGMGHGLWPMASRMTAFRARPMACSLQNGYAESNGAAAVSKAECTRRARSCRQAVLGGLVDEPPLNLGTSPSTRPCAHTGIHHASLPNRHPTQAGLFCRPLATSADPSVLLWPTLYGQHYTANTTQPTLYGQHYMASTVPAPAGKRFGCFGRRDYY